MAKAKSDKGKEPKDKGTSLLEWISAAIGLVIAIALLGFIASDALRTSDGPPILTVTPADIVTGEGVYVVEVKIANASRRTAAAVSIEGTLQDGGQTVETSTATLSFVPGHSERKAGLIFTRDPRRHALEVRATGYEEP